MQGELKFVVTTEGFDKVKAGLADVQKGLAQTSVQTQKFDSSLGKLQNGIKGTNTTLVNFGRVVQDAPFGLVGIANNIDPLINSFQNLKAETGSTGGAFKELAKGLVGPAGLAIAVSAITSLLITFGDQIEIFPKEIDKLSDKLQELGGNVDRAKKSFDNLSDSIKFFQEIAKLDIKINLGDTFEAQRRSAVVDVNAAREGIKAATLFRDKAGAAFLEVQREFERYKKSQDEAFTTLSGGTAIANDFVVKLQKIGNIYSASEASLSILNKQERLYIDALRARKKELLDAENVLTRSYRNSEIATKSYYLLLADEQRNQNKASRDAENTGPVKALDTLDKKVKQVAGTLSEFQARFPGGLPSLFGVGDSAPGGIQLPKLLIDFADEVNNFFTNAAQNIATNFAENLGNALTGAASIGDFFRGIYQIIGDGLVQLGKQLLAAVILVDKIKKLFLTNPVLAIAGAIGLIAVGTVLKNLSNVNAFATGVRNFSGGTALVGERGPELVTLPRGSNVLPAAQTASFMGGGSGFIAETRISGADLLLTLKRAGGQYNRTT